MDTWFMGFTPDLVAGVYIGYDKPQTLGKKETGGSVALPAFLSFMKEALAKQPITPFRIPRGIQLVKINMHTGEPAAADAEDKDVIQEAFVTGDALFIPGVNERMPGQGTPTAEPVPEEGTLGKSEMSITVEPAPMVIPPKESPSAPVVGTGGLY